MNTYEKVTNKEVGLGKVMISGQWSYPKDPIIKILVGFLAQREEP